MKTYLKIFGIAFIVFTIIIYIGVNAFTKMYKPDDFDEVKPYNPEVTLPTGDIKNKPTANETVKVKEKTELEKLVETSDRINVLVVGHEGKRADTIMIASYDPDKKLIDVISVPRDTYININSFTDEAQYHKINSVFGAKTSNGGGVKGLMQVTANILQVPIDYYVQLDYQAVSSIVDVLGGVQVNVHIDMLYDDPKADPPLHIEIAKGSQLLDGETAVKYLRWRQNNVKDGPGDDISRTSRQRAFIVKLLKKSVSMKLPSVISTGFKFIKTDMDLAEALYYGNSAVGLDLSKVKTYVLPGDPIDKSPWYYMHDYDKVDTLMQEIYGRE